MNHQEHPETGSEEQQLPPQGYYDPNAAATAADAAAAEQDAGAAAGAGGVFSNVAQGLSGHYRNIMTTYWQNTIDTIERDLPSSAESFKMHQLPLARIKKVMKADEDVKMISAEAPILFAKGCDIFITELTMRAWIHAEENKRRTLQRSDIASALQKSDMFDFLIDIVPREEAMASSSAAARRQKGAYVQYEEAEYEQALEEDRGEGQQLEYDETGAPYEQQQQDQDQEQDPQQQPQSQQPQQYVGELDNMYQGYRQYQ